ncbi:MAG TPA: ATP-dependent DNA ligase [Acidimicrobiia bacterium]|nr:ATP-dependent DNA ligase [Acidimicrobiia bacterium]
MIVNPMLATSGPLPTDQARWAFEPKWDGFRAIVSGDGRRLRVWSRRGTDLAGRLPELAALGRALPSGTTLDGELVVFDSQGRVDFDGMRRRGFGQAAAGRLVFVAFDVLTIAGTDVMATSWDTRRTMLVDLGVEGAAWCTTPAYPGEGTALLEATQAQGIEGVIAKRLDSPYRPGVRTTAWVKTKHFDRARFDVIGVAPTPAGRYALLLGWPGVEGPARYAGRVEWGFSRERFAELIARATPTDISPPGATNPPGVVFFEPGVVANVRYLANSQLRHATLQSLDFASGELP